MHWQPRFLFDPDSLSQTRVRATGPALLNCDLGGDLVEGRIGNLVGLDFGSSLSYFFEGLEHGWIGATLISLRVLSLIPQTDSHNFRSVRSDECDFILKALLLSKQGNDFLL